MLKKRVYSFLAFCAAILGSQAFAAQAMIDIKATILECGARSDIQEACKQDDRCCIKTEQQTETNWNKHTQEYESTQSIVFE